MSFLLCGLDGDYEKGKAAFEAGDYVTARDLFASLNDIFAKSDTDCAADIMIALEVRDYLEKSERALSSLHPK